MESLEKNGEQFQELRKRIEKMASEEDGRFEFEDALKEAFEDARFFLTRAVHKTMDNEAVNDEDLKELEDSLNKLKGLLP